MKSEKKSTTQASRKPGLVLSPSIKNMTDKEIEEMVEAMVEALLGPDLEEKKA